MDSDGSSAIRLVVGLVSFASQLIGVELLCGAIALLYSPVVMAVHVAIAVTVWRTVPARPRRVSEPGRLTLTNVALGSVLAFVGALAVQFSFTGTPTDIDDTTYHLSNAAFWIQVHSLWTLPPVNPGILTNAYPSDGELLVSWVMQPFHGPQLAALPILLFGLLTLASCALIAETLGGRPSVGLLGGATLVLAPLSWQTQVHSALTDWTATGGLIASVALVLYGHGRAQWRWPLLAGLALGIAVGSKDTAVVPAATVVVLGMILFSVRSRWRASALVVVGTVILAGLWFVRNAVDTGNPLYPEAVGIGGRTLLQGAVSPVTRYSTSLLQDVAHGDSAALRAWITSVRLTIGLPIVVAAGALLCFVGRTRRSVLGLCAGLSVVWFVIYLGEPYTGPAAVPIFIAEQLRYALPALTLAAVCACVRWRPMILVAWAALVADLYHILRGSTSDPVLDVSTRVLLVSVVVAALTAWWLWRLPGFMGATRPGGGRFQKSLGVAVALLVATVFIAAYSVHRAPRPSRLDSSLAASGEARGPIMIIGDTDVFAAFGDRMQHRVVDGGQGGAAGEAVISSPNRLDARIRAIHPAAVVVGPSNEPGVLPGWSPAGYRLLYIDGGNDVYVHESPS